VPDELEELEEFDEFEEFAERDLCNAVFWDVNLRRARFRDVDFSDVTITHSMLVDVDIDARIDGVTINGVDVTAYVNAHDRWYPLRSMLSPDDPAAMQETWRALEHEWSSTLDQARRLDEAQLHRSVGGEWSFVETLRHLVFAIDKWVGMPVLGDPALHPIGLPNTGSLDFDWPGLDRHAQPSVDEALGVRSQRAARLRAFLERVTPEDLSRQVDVLENGSATVTQCLHVVFEEEFQHNRYALRDLAALAG
jgi:hypothetical protein